MPSSTYTLLDVINVVGFRVADFKQRLETLENGDIATVNMIAIVNEVLRDIARVKPLPMMNGRHSFATVDDYQTGTVAVTKGSATVTGTDTVWTSDMQDRAFSLMGKSGIYRISEVVSTTSLTLADAWALDSGSDQAYVIAQDRYALPADFSDFIMVTLDGATSRRLDIKRPTEIDMQRYGIRLAPLSIGAPTMVSRYDKDTTGNWEVELDPFPDNEYRIAIRYKRVPTRLQHDHDVVPLADENIDFLINGSVAKWKSIMTPELLNLYKDWKTSDLPIYAAFDQKTTDEVLRLTPDDVMRSGGPRSTIFDTR